jgi:hypothetical protein
MPVEKIVDYNDPDLYRAFIFEEVDILSNVLLALSHYRDKCGERWPKIISVHHDNRLSFGFGSDTKLVRDKWGLRDCLYMSLHKPWADTGITRKRTPKPKQRTPVEDITGKFFRFR